MVGGSGPLHPGDGGALLTLGLVRPWGETFPRWIPILGGRRVPPRLAIIPAALVSVLVTSAGLMFIRFVLTGALAEVFEFGEDLGWIALAPELLWPLWGAALAAATLALPLPATGPMRALRQALAGTGGRHMESSER